MNSQTAFRCRSMRLPVTTAAAALVCALQLGLPKPSLASPPPWAPAHGYYKKPGHWKHGYRAPAVGVYVSPYVVDGRCNREALGAVLGGVVGGVAGSNVGRGDGRTAATIVGTIVGAIIGGSIGRSMDRTDVACVGQALEYAEQGAPVTWTNPDTGARYRVTPGPSYPDAGGYCREFFREAVIGGRLDKIYGTACRQPDGSWRIVR
jgi:surface antigen